MKKSELKNRMIVELRSGDRYMVVDDVLINEGGNFSLDNFTDDLKHINPKYRADDIVKVYDLARCLSDIEDCHCTRNVIWEHDEYFTGKAMYLGEELKNCVSPITMGYTAGKIYEFINGFTHDDQGDRRPFPSLDVSEVHGLTEDDLVAFGFYPITD